MPVIPLPAQVDPTEGAGSLLDAEPKVIADISLAAEGYVLNTADDRPTIAAADDAGEHYARLTLTQLTADARAAGADRLAPLRIHDAPRFAWRGAMLDVVRHFMPVETVLAYLDDLAALKINRLHLHLTDDQGWRVPIASRPLLTEIGASTQVGGGGGGSYTEEEIATIVEHAAAHHIVIVPEIDLPGHTTAALTAYPELAVDGVVPEPYEGIEVGFSTLDPNNEITYAFVEDVIGEVAAMFPGPWLHIGGDECLSTPEADFLHFIERATAIVAAHGKTVIGWHEMGRSRALPAGTIGQYWNLTTPLSVDGHGNPADHAAHVRSFTDQGGSIILSPADVAYFDIKYTEDHPIGLMWPGKPTTLEDAFGWEPTEVVPGLDEGSILGLEAPIFTETIVDLDALRSMAFPRMAALAELAWSPRPVDGAARDLDGLRERLVGLARRWDADGIQYERVPGVDWPSGGTAGGTAAGSQKDARPADTLGA